MNPSNDNSFGSFSSSGENPNMMTGGMNYTGPVSSGTGDIVLDNGVGKKVNKRTIIIGGVVVLLLVIIVIVAVILVRTFGSQISGGTKEKFNIFANYVLYGEEKTSEIDPELDLSYDYYFNNESNKTVLYGETSKLLDNFIAAYGDYSGEDLPGKEYLNERIEYEKSLLEFMKATSLKTRITFSDILEKYREGGRDSALVYANRYYVFSDSENSSYVESFLEDYGYWVENALAVLDLYNENGCLIDESAIPECIVGKGNAELTESLNQKMNELGRSERFLDWDFNVSDSFILGVFVINAQINNGDVSRYVTTIEGGDEDE